MPKNKRKAKITRDKTLNNNSNNLFFAAGSQFDQTKYLLYFAIN